MDKLQTLIKQHISKVLVYERNLPGYATAGIRTVADWPVNAQRNALYETQNLQPVTKVGSAAELQMESLNLR